VDALERDEVIIYPTDTGYAFGCAYPSAKGIAKIRKLKGFHERHPKSLTMLVNDLAEVARYGHLSNQAFRLVRRLLPGPYTMVLRATSEVPRSMRNRDHEVGLRVPDHAICRLLVELLGRPLLTGSVTTAEAQPEVEDPEQLALRYDREVAAVVDVGTLWPEPSTVLRLIDDHIEVLRLGQGPIDLG